MSAKKIAVTSLVFAIIAIGLIMVSQRSGTPSPTKATISEILANPSAWENKPVEVEGIIDGVITIPEIRLPFNYWLIDKANKTNRFGLLWNRETLRAGEHALITGIVKSGYTKRLTAEGWVNSTLVYYIEARAVGLEASAHPVISLFVGDRYLPAAFPMAIIAVTMALTSGGVIVGNALLSLGLTRIFLLASAAAIITDVFVSLLLIGPFGSLGAAIARASLTIVLFLIPLHYLRRKVGQHLDKEAFLKSLASSSVMAVAVLFVQSVWMSKYLLPLYISVGGIVYLLMLRLLGAVQKEDIELLRRLLPKRISFVASALEFVYVGKDRENNTIVIQLIQQYLGKRLEPLTNPIGSFLLSKEVSK